jgi:uncharacterized protein (DUF2147 family)
LQKKLLFLLSFFILLSSLIRADEVTGFWQTIDKKTKRPSSVIAVYTYQGMYYGKIIATCDKQGRVEETLVYPQSRAPGVVGNPYYCGLDIIWACAPTGNGQYKGHVIDPREGKCYNAKIWNENGNLILRGEVFVFGRNETLIRFPDEGFTPHFDRPNLATLKPNPYRLNK